LSTGRRQSKHAIAAIAVFERRKLAGLRLRDGLTDATERRFDGPRFRIKPFGIRSVHVGLLPGAEILRRVAEYRCCRYGHNRSPMPRRDHGRMTASYRNFQPAHSDCEPRAQDALPPTQAIAFDIGRSQGIGD
jgi:hypothetical protein